MRSHIWPAHQEAIFAAELLQPADKILASQSNQQHRVLLKVCDNEQVRESEGCMQQMISCIRHRLCMAAHLSCSPAGLARQPGSKLGVHSSGPAQGQVEQPVIAPQVRQLLHYLAQVTGQRNLHHSQEVSQMHSCQQNYKAMSPVFRGGA